MSPSILCLSIFYLLGARMDAVFKRFRGKIGSMTLKGALRLGLLATFCIAALLLTIRALVGPFSLVRSPLNVEAIAAVSAMLLWASSRTQASTDQGQSPQPTLPTAWCIATLIVLVAAAFWHSLSFPLIFDDYVHLPAVLHAPSSFWVDQWTIPAVDHFFRPLGMYDYRIDAMFAGHDEFRWRLGNLVWHIANCILVFFLARRLGLNSWAALFAGLLFGIHGSRPESAAWVAGRFDLLATFFLLSSLLCFYRASHTKRQGLWIAVALLAGAAALLSKEAAYGWPLLVTLLFWRKLPLRLLVTPYAVSAAIFLYRWVLLSGIGGYQTGSQPDIFTFSLIRTIKALGWRIWAILWFPINWTHQPDMFLCLTLLCAMLGIGWLLWNRANLHWPALAFVWIASLPVQHLLLIGQDMEKSRVLYLPSVGFAVLVGFALQSVPKFRGALLAGATIILFQFATLQHNLSIVEPVTILGRAACQQVGRAAALTNGAIAVANLPKLRDGVYFLGNGFPQCVEWRTGVPSNRVHLVSISDQASSPGTSPTLSWDESAALFVPVP
ncbi:MAG: hypothetical protein ABI824_10835 [Acidobacteriota bacterium]